MKKLIPASLCLAGVLLALIFGAQVADASVTISNSGNDFTVTGSNSRDIIEVARSTAGVTSFRTNSSVVDNTTLAMLCATYNGGASLSCVHVGTPSVTVYGRDGIDSIYTDERDWSFNAVAFQAIVYGGNDGDYIETGSENDTVYGNSGLDNIHIGPGDDQIYSNDGESDSIYCGSGNDTLSNDMHDVLTSC